MDSTVDVLSEQPWGQTYYERRMGWTYGYYGRQHITPVEIDAQFFLVKDSRASYWLRGDIVKFEAGYHRWNLRENWRQWFMSKQDYLNTLAHDETLCRDKRIPLYARLEYGLLVSRYKWAKDKQWKVFYDYGSIILMLTGSKAGHMRRYFVTCPYMIFSRYPYDHVIPYHVMRGDEEIPEFGRLHEAMNYSNGDKNQFILNMIESFQNKNYANKLEDKYDTPANFCVV